MKKVLISFISIIMIFSAIGTVFAAEVNTGKVTTTLSSSTVIAGKEFTITISASDSSKVNSVSFGQVQVYKSGNTQTSIGAISVKNLAPATDEVQRFTEGNITAFVYMGSNFENSKEMAKIVLATEDNLEEGKYIIRIPDLIVYNKNDDETHIGTKDVEVTIKKDGTTAEDPEPSEDPKPSEKPKDEIVEEDKSGSGKGSSSGSGKSTGSGSNSGSGKKLPQTGASEAIIIAIAGLAVFGTTSYILYRKNRIY